MQPYHSIRWIDGAVSMLDQRILPHRTEYLTFRTHEEVAAAIRDMVIRGAPAIGAAAAFGLALAANRSQADSPAMLRDDLASAAGVLRQARPTAVNLFWAIERVLEEAANPAHETARAVREAVVAEAHAIFREDGEVCRAIGRNALDLIPDRARIFHHCNTGGLATVEYGTALGVIRSAHEAGKAVHALLDETRPRLQGARLSAWELIQLGVPFTVLADGASGHIMRTQGADLCVVGCDRVAANGDTANKIGTYNLALAARAHDVPFYVAAPTSTIDLSLAHGDLIEIEERAAEEVSHIEGTAVVPAGSPVANPAFDVTPAGFITAIITEIGVARPPFGESLQAHVAAARKRIASDAINPPS